MSESGKRKLQKTIIYLNKLSISNPDKFDEELTKRMKPQMPKLLHKIQKQKNISTLNSNLIFSIAENAVSHWLGKGYDTVLAQKCKSVSALHHACSKAVALKFGTEQYKVTLRWPETKAEAIKG